MRTNNRGIIYGYFSLSSFFGAKDAVFDDEEKSYGQRALVQFVLVRSPFF